MITWTTKDSYNTKKGISFKHIRTIKHQTRQHNKQQYNKGLL